MNSRRLSRALQRLWVASEKKRWVYGTIGRINADATATLIVAERADFVWVQMDTGTLSIARNDGHVPLRAGLPVRMRDEGGVLVIDGVDSASLENDPEAPDESGVPRHKFTSHIDVPSAYTGAGGQIVKVNDTETALVFADEATGPIGGFGGDSMEYIFSTEITDADPGAGTLRYNHATFASITQLFIDDVNVSATDVQAWLGALDDSTNTVKGTLRVFKRDDSTIFQDFQITGASVEATGYWKLAVTPLVSTAALAETDAIVVSFARAGNVGATGAQGVQGIQGIQGVQGVQGNAGAQGIQGVPGDTGPAGADGTDGADFVTDLAAASVDDSIADADIWGYVTGGILVKTAWSNIKAVLKTYFDTLYAVLLGTAGGQTLHGGTAANEDLRLKGTAHATKTSSYVTLQEDGGNVAVGKASADRTLVVSAATNPTITIDGPAIDFSANQQAAFGAYADEAASVSLANNLTGGSWWKSFSKAAAGGIGSYWTHYQENDGTTFASFEYHASKHNGSGALTTHGVAAVIWALYNHTTNLIAVLGNGFVGIGGVLTPSGVLSILAGTSTDHANVGGVLYVSTAQVGNVGTGEDDLASFSVPANTLAVNGQNLWFEASGTIANTAATKRIRVRFGTTGVNLVVDTGAGFGGTLSVWRLRGRIFRTGAATQKAECMVTIDNALRSGVVIGLDQTLSGAVTLKVTGESTANNDILIESFIVGWDNVNT